MSSRRIWKQIFRRVRLYLPLVLLLLTAMVVFLPISASWLARKAEKEIALRTGLDVTLEQLQIIIADGRIDMYGAALHGDDPDAPPFELRHVQAEGALRGLLAGGERWPEIVRIDSPSPLEVRRTPEGGYELAGPFRTLLQSIEKLTQQSRTGRTSGTTASAPPSSRVGRTPTILLRDLRINVEPPSDDIPPLVIRIDEARIFERGSATAPISAQITGVATADSTEEFDLFLTWFPDQDRVSLRGELTGAGLPFFIPALGDFQGQVRRLRVDFEGTREENGTFTGALTINAGQFEVRRSRLGGERWADAPLEIRLRAEFDPVEARLTVGEVALLGQQIDIAARGEVLLRDEFPGEAQLAINRLPPAALTLGRNELSERLGIRVTAAASSPTLRMDLRTRGDFAEPLDMDYRASLRLAGWRFDAQGLPDAIDLQNLDVAASNELITLRDLSVNFGGLALSARGEVPLSQSDDRQYGSVSVEASGAAESAFDLLSQLDVLPPDFTSFEAPVVVQADLSMLATEQPTGEILFSFYHEDSSATVSWGQGVLGLRRFLQPVRLDPGLVRYEKGILQVERIGAALEDIRATIDGEVTGGILSATDSPLQFTGRATAAGRLSQLLQHLGHEVKLPDLPRDLDGQFQLALDASGTSSDLETPDYNLRLFLDQVHGTIATPHRLVPLTELTAELAMDPRQINLRRLSILVEDPATGPTQVDLSGQATAELIRMEVKARTQLEFLTTVLAKDLSDLLMVGVLPAAGWGELRPVEPLPPGPDVARRWASLLMQDGVKVRFDREADLQADFQVDYRPESPVEITVRELPVRFENIRGNARFTPKGIEFWSARADIGSAKDIRVDTGLVQLGKPVIVTFDASAEYIDVNEWLEGWGEMPWASKPFSSVPGWASNPDPVKFVEVNGTISSKRIKFLQFTGGQVKTGLKVESWSRIPTRLWVEDLVAGELYDGTGQGKLALQFPARERPIVHIDAAVKHINLKTFMDDLLEREQAMDGYLTGNLGFDGQLLNYPTYRGQGDYVVLDSSFAREIVPAYAQNLIAATTGAEGRDTTIRGTVRMEDQKVHFPDMELLSSLINMTADGYVDFRGNLVFDISASVISRQLKNIPLMGLVGDLVDFLGKNVVSYRLRGNIKEPDPQAIATLQKHLENMGDLLRETRQREEGQTD